MELENRTRGSRASPENGGLNRSSGSLIADTFKSGQNAPDVHVLDEGNFVLDTAADQIARLVQGFPKELRPGFAG